MGLVSLQENCSSLDTLSVWHEVSGLICNSDPAKPASLSTEPAISPTDVSVFPIKLLEARQIDSQRYPTRYLFLQDIPAFPGMSAWEGHYRRERYCLETFYLDATLNSQNNGKL